MALYRAVPIRLRPLARSEERSRCLPCLELLVPITNDCSARIAQFDARRLTARTPSGHVAFAHVHLDLQASFFRLGLKGPCRKVQANQGGQMDGSLFFMDVESDVEFRGRV